jgi:hypothetical protein
MMLLRACLGQHWYGIYSLTRTCIKLELAPPVSYYTMNARGRDGWLEGG